MRSLFQPKYRHLPDEELAQRSAVGDQRAFEELYERYSKPLVAYFLKMLRNNRELAEDMAQDVFMKLINKPELYDSSRAFKTWIYSVAHNQCKNVYRHDTVVEAASSTIAQGLNHLSYNTADSVHDHSAFHDALSAVLAELDPDRRTTFLLRYEQELAVKEISEIMSCSEGTVKSRLFYTLKLLSERLGAFKNLLYSDRK